jgi:Zn-dependent protease
VLLAITLHEAAHGFVARWLGDDTAYRLGRVTLNPFKHIDPFATVILPAVLLIASGGRIAFGAAKPVPVNFRALGNPRRDMVLVAVAGPASNFVQAVIAVGLMQAAALLPGTVGHWVFWNLYNAAWINLILCIFNLLPVPPLDGGRVAVAVLPAPLANRLARLERLGIGIILVAILVLPWIAGELGFDFNVFWWLVGNPAQQLMGMIGQVFGVNLP